MAAQLSLASAKIIKPNGEVVESAQVLVRGNVLTLRHGGASDVYPDVQAVTQTRRGVWTIRFPDATEVTVERIGRSCCGGRR